MHAQSRYHHLQRGMQSPPFSISLQHQLPDKDRRDREPEKHYRYNSRRQLVFVGYVGAPVLYELRCDLASSEGGG